MVHGEIWPRETEKLTLELGKEEEIGIMVHLTIDERFKIY